MLVNMKQYFVMTQRGSSNMHWLAKGIEKGSQQFVCELEEKLSLHFQISILELRRARSHGVPKSQVPLMLASSNMEAKFGPLSLQKSIKVWLNIVKLARILIIYSWDLC